MTLEELKSELGTTLKRITSYGSDAYYIEKRFASTQTGRAEDLTKAEIVKMIRKLRDDCLLWCDDMIGWAHEEYLQGPKGPGRLKTACYLSAL